jgi:hypothetical protein
MSIFDSLSTDEGQAAFWGAFFAAFFSLVIYALTRFLTGLGNRKKKHYDRLVMLEGKLNQHLNRSYQNIYVIRGVLEITKANRISYNNIDTLQLEPLGDHHDLLDIDIVNEVFAYDRNLDALNADLGGISGMYSEMRSMLIRGEMNLEDFIAKYPGLPIDLEVIFKSWKRHVEDIIDLAVLVRISIKRDKGWYINFRHWLMSRKMQSPTIKEVKKERVKLMKEMEEVRKASVKKINEIYGEKK